MNGDTGQLPALFDRRHFVLGSGALLIGGCASCPTPLVPPFPRGPARLSDAHVHLFNLADLPVSGFLEDVLIPNRFSKAKAYWWALKDLVEWVRTWAPTARGEMDGLYAALAGPPPERHVSNDRFARRISDRIRNQSRRSRFNPARGGTGLLGASDTERLTGPDSYALLAALLTSSGLPQGQRRSLLEGRSTTAAFREATEVSPQLIRDIIEGRVEAAPGFQQMLRAAKAEESACLTEMIGCGTEQCVQEASAPLDLELARIFGYFRWISDMLQTRCGHVRSYLDLTQTTDWRPSLLVHHLVDYDRWVGDEPSARSGHSEQIEFWTRYSDAVAGATDLRTFAGYDPLKHAEQVLERETPWFASLQTYFLNGKFGRPGPRIAGFKLYPPMGFKPVGNKRGDYQCVKRAGGRVSARWKDKFPGEDIGLRLDAALDEFYRFCVANEVPVMAHAIQGNEAAPCFGQRANPKHWAELFRSKPYLRTMRLCLGHIVNSAKCFVEAVEALDAPGPGAPPPPPQVWALHGTRDLLEMSGRGEADVYADIGYLSEMLDEPTEAEPHFPARFFKALKRYCERYDPGCRRIMFGTDWIMVGQELNYELYLQRVLGGLKAARWPEDWQDRFLRTNLHRFLRLPDRDIDLASGRSCSAGSFFAPDEPSRS